MSYLLKAAWKLVLSICRSQFNCGLIIFALAINCAVAAGIPLQPLIDAVAEGGTLRLTPGVYQGPVILHKTITLEGGGKAVIQGNGKGTVLAVLASARSSIVRGLHIRGSGELHDSIDAGMHLEGEGHLVENNQLSDVLFGFDLKQTTGVRIVGNYMHGKDLPLGMRGDAIRVWGSHDNLIEANRFERARDLTFINSPDNRIAKNEFRDGRYGMHFIFSPRLQVESNRLENTGTGIIVLYSPGVTLRGNYVAHALTSGGAGIVFKESRDALVEGNTVLHCAVGLKANASHEALGVLTVRKNRFAHNIIGMFFYGEAGGHRFSDNHFENNLTTVAISAPGAGGGNLWAANRWDEYQGFDRNDDGFGDTPHEAYLFADRIWMDTPMATFFRNSPLLELLDFLERLAPFSSPHRVLQDPSPRIR